MNKFLRLLPVFDTFRCCRAAVGTGILMGMGMGTVINSHRLMGFYGDFLIEVRFSENVLNMELMY